jgi:hypothetical protein
MLTSRRQRFDWGGTAQPARVTSRMMEAAIAQTQVRNQSRLIKLNPVHGARQKRFGRFVTGPPAWWGYYKTWLGLRNPGFLKSLHKRKAAARLTATSQ